MTAHLARPVSPHDAPALPTDHELNDPNDIQLFLFGSMGGGGQASGRHGMEKAQLDSADPKRRSASRAMMERGPSGELGFIR